MRRKSERTSATKKTKSPEKKLEKVKRTRTRRRKQSSSSENESADEKPPVPIEENIVVEKKPPGTPVKEDTTGETLDQVWHVKATEASGDVGEIQKLKICLTRPPSTPERADRSPRSKRKHSRATSSSDTPSNEGEEKKKKHRSKRATRESKDESEKNHDSQEEPDVDAEPRRSGEKPISELANTSEPVPDDTPMSTTNEEDKSGSNVDQSKGSTDTEEVFRSDKANDSKKSDADTTVASPRVETTVVSTEIEPSEDKENKSAEDHSRDTSEDKSEVLELHDDDNRCESSDTEVNKSVSGSTKQEEQSVDTVKGRQTDNANQNKMSEDPKEEQKSGDSKEEKSTESSKQDQKAEEPKEEKQPGDKDQDLETRTDEVSKIEGKTEDTLSKEKPCDSNESNKSDESHVVENSQKKHTKVRKVSESSKEVEEPSKNRIERSDSTHSQQEDNSQNGSSAPIVISRKRRWGSRPTKIQTQKSITISTDVLKDIIPDVKPVEFDEVIEDKKSKREVTEKIERPVLPKIVIDNTESIEVKKKVAEEKEREIVKPRDSHLMSNRKISIVKENDSIITRPPSPPKHKQSCILFITNLVRPFTLPQLKNLLQRTGRIAEDGFWIDRIKSKCYVKYETEDQAVETRHALHGVTWPVSNPKVLQVDFSNEESFEKAKLNEDTENAQVSTIPGTVEDWLREQDMKRERGELEKPYERKPVTREWDVGKNDKDNKDKIRRNEDRPLGLDKRRHRSPERSPEPARKFKKKEEEAPAKLLDDLFRKTKTTPCIYWLPLSADTIAVKEEQRRQHMAEHERRLQELRRTHRRH